MLDQPDYVGLLDAFAASLGDDSSAPVGVTSTTATRISVYRNNVRLNRITALADAFGNVVKLVGRDYFCALARAYVDCTPARSANLHDDGAHLPTFVRGFEPAAGLPYLGDVADADWRLHRAYFAEDSHAIDSSVLARLGPERFAAAAIRFVPSVDLARSNSWPIADILRMHEGGAPAHLGAGGQSVLIWRESFAVRWQPLGPADAEAITALMAGVAVESAFANSGADAGSLLSQLFGHRLVHAIEEPDHEKNR